MSEENNDKKHLFSQWLEKLQQESWQLELLISGFALYGIWASREVIQNVNDYIVLNQPDLIISGLAERTSTILEVGWTIFFINLLTHVIFRGFWIGTIGLRYVSGEIDYDSLNYSKVLTEYLRRKVGSFDDFIEKLEKFCSVLFAYTFLLFFITLSVILYSVWFNALAVLLFKVLEFRETDMWATVALFVYLGMGMFIMIDFLTFGVFKRIKEKRFSKVYKYFYIMASVITFSFLYRPLLYNFLDDKYTKRLIWISVPYFLLVILVFPGLRVGNPYYPEFDGNYEGSGSMLEEEMVKWWRYEDLRAQRLEINGDLEDHRILGPICLSNFECEKSDLRFFVRQYPRDTRYFESEEEISAFNVQGLTHEAFGVEEDDPDVEKLEEEEREVIRKFREDMDILRKEDRQLYISKVDSIHGVYKEKKKELMYQKLLKLKDSSFRHYRVELNGEDVTDKINSHFYLHPNAGERGFLCYLAIDSLERGIHQLKLNKFKERNLQGEVEYNEYVTPFMVP